MSVDSQLSPSASHSSNSSVQRLSPYPLPPLSPTSSLAYRPLLSQLSSLQSDLLSELEDELSSSKLDTSSIKDICHYFLSEYLRVGDKWGAKQRERERERGGEGPRLSDVPDSVLIECPLIQPQWRVRLWKILLGCANKDESLIAQHLALHPLVGDEQFSSERIEEGEGEDDALAHAQRRSEKAGHQAETIAQERLIHRDVTRTRPHDPRLLPSYRSSLSLLLTFYCRSRGVAYKQGLNEILTPLLILTKESSGASLDVAYNLFYSLIQRFLPSIFSDSDFIGLRCIFRSFRLLLLYFDPQLAQHVDHHNILPELYATPWFITLFARDCHLDVLYFLWDVYLIEDDPFFHYFLALALLIQQRDRLLSLDAASLPISLRQLRLSSLLPLLAKARALREQTPAAMRQHLFDITFTVKSAEVMEIISTYDSLLPALTTPVSELLQPVIAEGAEGPPIKYVMVDVREKRQWENGHVAGARHLNPCALFEEDKLEKALAEYDAVKGQHLCIIGPDMRTYNSLLGLATSASTASAGGAGAVAAMPVLEGFLGAIRNATVDAEEGHRMYLTPRELVGMEREDLKREVARKWQQGKGAAPPVAAVITGAKASRSPSPAPAAASAPPPALTPETNFSASTNAAQPAASSAAGDAAVAAGDPTASPPAAAAPLLHLTFPATSPLTDPYTASFVHVFLQRGFPHVSVCEGGYPACHELILNLNKQKSRAPPAAASSSPASPPSTAAVALALPSVPELVSHHPINCLSCSPLLYVKWREDKKKRQEEMEKKMERERVAAERKAREEAEREKQRLAAAEKERERLAKAEQEKKAREEAAAERQRRREAGEVVEEPVEPGSAAVAAAASEKLSSLKRWLNDKGKAATTGRHSPQPYIVAPPVAAAQEKKDGVETPSSSKPPAEAAPATDGSAAAAPPSSAASAASSASSYFSKLQSQASVLAKKLAENAAALAAAPPPPPPATPRQRLAAQLAAEKRTEKEQSTSVDLREWIKDGSISLFTAHEVRRIEQSSQGLLIPRALAVTDTYIITLRPDNSKHAGKDRDRRDSEESAATPVTTTSGWLDRVVGAVQQAAVAATTPPVPTAATVAASVTKAESEASASSASASSASAFSLAPADDPSLMIDSEAQSDTTLPPESPSNVASLMSPTSAHVIPPSSPVSSSSAAPAGSVSLTHPTNEAFSILGTGHAYIHSKRPIVLLDRITSKKERPCLLTFHWKTPTSSAGITGPPLAGPTLFVIDRPKECIDVVRRKYSRAKRREKEELANRSQDAEEEEEEEEEEEDGEDEEEGEGEEEKQHAPGSDGIAGKGEKQGVTPPLAEPVPAPVLDESVPDL